jgi:hypothetical protein
VARSSADRGFLGIVLRSLTFACLGPVLVLTIVGGGILFLLLRAIDDFGNDSSDPAVSGWEAAWLGDVDGDGVPEVALLTWREQVSAVPQDWGVLRVLSGASGATLETLRELGTQGPVEERIGPAGDMDGDGKEELWWMVGDRELRVGPLGNPRLVLTIQAGSRCTPLGDLDGDRCVDLRVTRFPVLPDGSIASSLVSGRSGQVLWTITESHGYPGPACRVADLDGDGTDDIVLADSTTQVRVVSGKDGSRLHDLPRYVGWGYGSLETFGDFNGDGSLDVLQNRQIISAADGRVLASFDDRTNAPGAHSPGDVDGDGVLDVACNDETVKVFSGRHTSLLCEVQGSAGGGRGDWNGDGCADLLLIHNLEFWNPKEVPPDLWRKGRIEILSGKDGTILKTFDESVLPPVQ